MTMYTRHFPTADLLVDLQNTLPEPHWAEVIAALAHDANVITGLEERGFRATAIAAAGSTPARWSPGLLALLANSAPCQCEDLQALPLVPLDHDLAIKAQGALDTFSGQDLADHTPDWALTPEIGLSRLATAGLLALAWREKYRSSGAWDHLDAAMEGMPDQLAQTAIACLFAFVAEPDDYLRRLVQATPTTNHYGIGLALHSLLSNPLRPDQLRAHLGTLTSNLPLPEQITTLESLAQYKPEISRRVAQEILASLKTSTKRNEPLNRTQLDQVVLEADLLHLSGRDAQALPLLDEAWQTGQDIQSRVAARMALGARLTGDRAQALAAWEKAASASQQPDRYLAYLALDWIDAGNYEQAEHILPQDSSDPSILFVQAQLAMQGPTTDLHQARQHARSALAKASEGAFEHYPGLGRLLLNLNLPWEAITAFEKGLADRPNDPELLAYLSRAQYQAGRAHQAAQTMRMLVSLDPGELAWRHELAVFLEAAGQWENALRERTTILERSDMPNPEDLRALANSALHAGETKLAAQVCQQAMDMDPGNGLTYALFGQAQDELGDHEGALESFERGVQLSPHAPDTWLAYAQMLETHGQHNRALETLRAATHAVPDSARIHLALGESYLLEKGFTQAMTAFRTAAELEPDNPGIALHLGYTLHHLGRLEEAREALEPLHTAYPQDFDLAHRYARILLDLGEPQGALTALTGLIHTQPTQPEPYLDYARALLQLEQDPDQVVEAMRFVLDSAPDHLEARAMLAEGLAATGEREEAFEIYQGLLVSPLKEERSWRTRLALGFARTALPIGQAEAAIAALKEALQDDPQASDLHQLLAESYQAVSLEADALAAAREALRIGPDDLETLTWFAEHAIELHAQSEALAALSRAIELAPDRTDLLVLLGQTQFKVDEQRGAWETFQQILSSEVATGEDLRQAAHGFLDLGDPPSAVACLERALEAAEEPAPDLLLELSSSYAQSGDMDSALASLEEAIGLGPEVPELHLDKAELLIALDRHQAAEACLEHALNLASSETTILSRAVDMFREIGELDRALGLAEDWVKLSPQDLDARLTAAELARSRLQPDYARRILFDGLNLVERGDPEDPSGKPRQESIHVRFFCLSAELAMDAADLGGAEEALKSASRINLDSLRVQAGQVRLATMRGQTELASEAIDGLLAALEIHTEPKDDDSAPGNELDAGTLLAMADAALVQERWQPAMDLYRLANKTAPGEPYCQVRLVRALVTRGEIFDFRRHVEVRFHTPGEEALGEGTRVEWEAAVQAAVRAYPHEDHPPELLRWKRRGELLFNTGSPPSTGSGYPSENPDDVTAWVAALRRRGDRKGAVQAARGHPDQASVFAQLALALAPDDPQEALVAARLAVDQSPTEPIYQALKAYMASQARSLAEALEAIELALAHWPEEPLWHSLAADLHQEINTDEEMDARFAALGHLEQAAQLDPDKGSHHRRLGEAYLELGDTERAIEALQRANQREPEHAQGWLLLARAYLALGELAKAEEYAEQAMVLAPEMIEAHLLRGQIALQNHNYREALSRVRAALRLDESNVTTLQMQARALSGLNRPMEALAALEKAIPHASQPLPLFLDRIPLVRTAEGEGAALQALDELESGFPDNPAVLTMKTRFLAEAGRSEDAINLAQKALRLSGEGLSDQALGYLHHLIGRLRRRDGQLDQAVHHLSEAIQHVPEVVEPYLELGQAHLSRREYTQAVEVFERGVMIAPEDHRPYFHTGLAFKEFKDYGKAEAMLRKAAELAPNDLSIHRQLGAVVALNIVHNTREATIQS